MFAAATSEAKVNALPRAQITKPQDEATLRKKQVTGPKKRTLPLKLEAELSPESDNALLPRKRPRIQIQLSNNSEFTQLIGGKHSPIPKLKLEPQGPTPAISATALTPCQSCNKPCANIGLGDTCKDCLKATTGSFDKSVKGFVDYVEHKAREFVTKNPDFMKVENYSTQRYFRKETYENSEPLKSKIFQGIDPLDEHYLFNLFLFGFLSEQHSQEQVETIFMSLGYVRDLKHATDLFVKWQNEGYVWRPNLSGAKMTFETWMTELSDNWEATHGMKAGKKEILQSSRQLFETNPTQRQNDAVTRGAVLEDRTFCSPATKSSKLLPTLGFRKIDKEKNEVYVERFFNDVNQQLEIRLNNGNPGIRFNNENNGMEKGSKKTKPADPYFKYLFPLRPVELDELMYLFYKLDADSVKQKRGHGGAKKENQRQLVDGDESD
ncbi:hypothetical protein HDU99_003758 [Rhizoclosmatium hyalinum]|nr:hypothetical protein HDU99_003758 [Rhizoclosmatium hyalinum]